jgi:small subunit ribosomal protein S6
MLDPGQDEPAREALAQDARGRIESAGTLKDENKWGLRKMAYEIEQRNEADYRWFRFEGPAELLDGLNHNLKIADGVLRFRIFKVDPDSPAMVPPAVAAPAHGSRERGPQRARADAAAGAEEAEAESGDSDVAAEPATPAEVSDAPDEAPAEAPDAGEEPAAPAESPASAE